MKYCFLLFFLVFGSAVSGQDFMINLGGRSGVTSLNGRWETLVDFYSRGEKLRIYRADPPCGKTRFVEYRFGETSMLNVPGDWCSQNPELKYYENTVWYKREFDYDLKEHRRLFLCFGAANYRADVYFNGEKLGSHEGGFTPFQFEITDRVQAGSNQLVVEVNSARSRERIPALSYDWWNYGGLTRDVALVETAACYIDDYFLRLDRENPRRITVDVHLSGCGAGEEVCVGIPELGVSETFRTDASGSVRGVLHPGGRLKYWSPDEPKLYDVVIATGYESVTDRIGLRSIETRGSQLLLNGKPVFLKGVNCHDEIPMRQGRAHSDADARLLIAEVRALGCNFLRLTHFPPSERVVREAERNGLLLFEEIPQWGQIDFGNFRTDSLARVMLGEMIRRDRNRCAVIAWSLANETPLTPARDSSLLALLHHGRTLDDSRLFTAVTNKVDYSREHGAVMSRDTLFRHLDIVCVNKYFGWYTPWPVAPGKLFWKVFPDKPLVVTEFGGEALYGEHGSEDVASCWNEEYQARLYADYLEMLANIPNLNGISPWCLFDFRSPYRMNLKYQDGWNRKGLLSERGDRKKAWHVMHEFYSGL